MNITVISVGKLKEKYLKQAIDEYSKRLSRYCKLEIIELPDEKTPDNASEKEELQIKEKEGKLILSKIKDNMHVIAMDLKGNEITSEKFSKYIENCGVMGNSNITFVIGGSLGLSQEVIKRADYKLCFSKMTFPHQLFRVMLLEQVYRAFRIMKNETYHK
ncbi:23S rRNA (pseudouridine(1915)-N(3))-methyltransferase RlmH [Clostridium perfringens]|uniref:23S rRNA (pseudouridine(1915)-N(3))-methyltransferase RlmH n=1 Tax=Clostridium perfringens TaxID=1502 RepID=UPI000DA2EE47|nr:23S rRNA (pseudouridine(1915)-N(3))-methyltransferase RlmH [Clostridium perfringens]MDH5082294.1 Ribosomal RNA large subunit methyltransferase H [Clostridium perfringens]MDU5491997.1 23S rRNA (pseudouridine(1915)-N(3))-methyltransferase RlmH [Clostridium perfringens]RKP41798.1 23S rRNA (pseudouridine(1915)-N(3))-methyltransferase RlmH [Clostridium perfringens]SQG41667.1 rRNA large subunit methyltransferase [Clostridium perfringens]HAT4218696.1 23S rRNA (pseudouridine(1915)-N(3))-methyltrans